MKSFNDVYLTNFINFIILLKDSISTPNPEEAENLDDSYNYSMKEADKLRLMLLAWNYQNTATSRNGTSASEPNSMTNLWEQYQNALALSKPGNEQETPVRISENFLFENSTEFSVLQASPKINEDSINSPSETKDEDELSEDESDDRIDQVSRDPERLKAFNVILIINVSKDPFP